MAKRASGTGSIHKKTITRNGEVYDYWVAEVSAGFDPNTGKRVRKTFTGKTQREVREKLNLAVASIQQGEFFQPSKMSLGAWLDTWIADYCADKKALTLKTYKAQLETHIKPAIGGALLCKLSPIQIQHFYNDLAQSGHKIIKTDKKTGKKTTTEAPLSAKSIRNIHGVLSKALSVAVEIGLINHNPCDRVTVPRVEKKEIRPLNDEQVAAFLVAAASDQEMGFLLQTILLTGARESEALGITWDCIDFDAGTVKINKQLIKLPKASGGYRLGETKSSNIRVIKAAPTLIRLLKAREHQQMEQRLAAGECWVGWQTPTERKTALVFTTPIGEHHTPQSLYRHCKKVLEQIGAGDRCVHDLRHTYAVLSLQNGDDIKTVQGNLGHATAAFTLDVYGHVSDAMKQASADRMEQYLQKIK